MKSGTSGDGSNLQTDTTTLATVRRRHLCSSSHLDEIDDFHEHLNRQNADIQFTKEIEENGKIPFLDCLVTRDNNNKLNTTVYRKPTHTDNKNNYNKDFVRRNTYKNTGPNATPVTTVTIPCVKGTSETIARILQPCSIRVAHKPITTLRQLLTKVKDKDEPNRRQGAVYKIKCCDCQATYIGETGRNLNVRLTEHKRATRNGDINNHIAEHHLQTNHRIDWDSAECITYSTNYYQRLNLESWFTSLEQTPLNRCLQLPAPYKRLIDNVKETDKQ